MSAFESRTSAPAPQAEPSATPATNGISAESFRASFERYLQYTLAKQWKYATAADVLKAVSLATREQIIDQLLETERRYNEKKSKRVYYLSMEYLVGRSLRNNLVNLGVEDVVREALAGLGIDIEAIEETELDAALGNGGLGRLAACFLDSLATLGMPGYGYGINYEFGLFRQVIANGYQKERPDHWGGEGSPWLVPRPGSTFLLPVYGRVDQGRDGQNRLKPMWRDCRFVVGVAHDMPIVGYGGKTVNFLRLFSAQSSDDFDTEIFNSGDYIRAVEDKISSERISKVLYPSDNVSAGRELRLLQEYFLVASALRDIFRRFRHEHRDVDKLPSSVAIQLNDTHPALAVAELMRILVDDHEAPWDRAWEITRATLSFTNHTLLPEALEKWPVPLLERVLPRHLQIIYEINHRFLDQVATLWPGDMDRLRRMSLVEEGSPKQVRMAHLAIVGTHRTNGVAKLHSQLLRTSVFRDFHDVWPEAFVNKTNGVAPRRWILQANPRLAALLTSTLGPEWITDLDRLRDLEPFAEDANFREEFRRVKQANKERLAQTIQQQSGITVAPDSLFDIQAKRIHLYKRQLLHLLHVVHEYFSLVEDGVAPLVPRTHVFAGKAAPGYWAAKQVIKLIHNVAQVINQDPRARPWLRVAFLPDFRVSLAERIIPAADLSEQVSTAGMEASGTGNMKFAMNGALTTGTLDGANIEILEKVGGDNIFMFGLDAEQVAATKRDGAYDPHEICRADPRARRVVEAIGSNFFCSRESGLFRYVYDLLMDRGDEYLHLADFASYLETQERASRIYCSPDDWSTRAIRNVARVGTFSSDRTIREYATDIWRIAPGV